MTYTCPDGHSSASGDYCDVCGAPIGGSGGVAPPAAPGAVPPPLPGPSGYVNPLDLAPAGRPTPSAPGAPAAPAEQVCPHCAASNVPGALYCENCGYDFTTGQPPRPLDPPAGVAPPASGGLPADLVPPVDTSAGPPAEVSPGASVAAGPPPLASTVPPVTATSAPGHVEWVAEVWVDPDWYASQDVSEPCPSAGMPAVLPILDRTVLIGRLSTSRNIHPQIDLSSDNGVSRRHAQLNSDGQRWWVEDLQSANGTFVGAAGDALPTTPVPVGQRVELADDDRIFLGAWTRVVVRRATPEESTLGA
ncbi:MAG TPA: FHA domain-containing protein [Kineosporiaceae bacterium]